jgi:2-polyprenyl-3-methyl-5-hydroxy-6-metoxy-1,4-benzoquinol methylase
MSNLSQNQQQLVDPIFGRPSTLYIRKGRANYFIEPTTKLVFQSELPTVDEMEAYVQEQYQEGVYHEYSSARDLKYETGRRRLNAITTYGVNGTRYLDVGCATGVFMEAAQDTGFDVTGIEISEEASKMASDAVSDKIILADVNELVSETAARYDLITAYDILEHVQDPRAFLEDLSSALAPGGVLAIATPATDHFLRILMGSSWPMLQPMQHTFLFSKSGLRELLADIGFEEINVGPAEKVLTLEYLFEQVAEPSPTLGKFLIQLGKITPKFLRQKPIGLNISEMFVLARRPPANVSNTVE